jgi:hypothetical protein
MLRLIARRAGWNEMTVDIDREAGGLMPGINHQAVHSCLLKRLP